MDNQIEAFSRWLLETGPKKLRGVRRWGGFEDLPEAERETVETHSLWSAWLLGAMVSLEIKRGNVPLNVVRLFLCAPLHDVGEGDLGDLTYLIKNDPRIKKQLAEIEHERVTLLFDSFPAEIRDAFEDAYAVEGECGQTADGDFFNAVERIGYQLYGVQQVRKGRHEFVKRVLVNHHVQLITYSERFVSVEEFYAPFREEVAKLLQEEGLL